MEFSILSWWYFFIRVLRKNLLRFQDYGIFASVIIVCWVQLISFSYNIFSYRNCEGSIVFRKFSLITLVIRTHKNK